MKLRIFCLVSSLLLVGCATPVAYKIKETKTGIELTTKPSKLFGLIEMKGVPAGVYEGKIGDKEIKVNTKVDLKLLDINMSKISGG